MRGQERIRRALVQTGQLTWPEARRTSVYPGARKRKGGPGWFADVDGCTLDLGRTVQDALRTVHVLKPF